MERICYEHTKLNPNLADDRELVGYVVNAMRAAAPAAPAHVPEADFGNITLPEPDYDELWNPGGEYRVENIYCADTMRKCIEARQQAQRQLERAQEQLRVAKDNTKDAERYRWLAANVLAMDADADPDNLVRVWYGTDPAGCAYGKTLDEAIDAAIEASKKGGAA
jgi:hypothetical protein